MTETISGNHLLQMITSLGWDKIRGMLDVIPAGISIVTDASCKEILHNAKAAEFLRIKPWENFVYKSDGNQPVRIFSNNRELTPAELPFYRSVLNGEEVRGFELEFFWDDGVHKIMRGNSSPIVKEDGTIAGAIGSFEDITRCVRVGKALRQCEVRKSFLLKLGDALRPLTDARAIQDAATGLLVRHLQVEQASYAEYAADTIVVHSEEPGEAVQPLTGGGAYKICDFPASAALLRAGKDLVVPDAFSFPAFSASERARFAALKVRAVIAAPLMREGRFAAVFTVGQATPRRWTTAEVDLVREVAGRTWTAVQRARAEAELKKTLDHLEEKVAERTRELAQERQRLLDVLETIPFRIFLLTPGYKVLFANRVIREIFGKPDGRYCYDYFHGRRGPCEFCQTYLPLETGDPRHWAAKTPGGRILDVYDLPFADADGSQLILKMYVDVTERENATRALRQSEERLAKIFYHSPVMLAIIRMRDNVFIDVNQKFIENTGYSREEILGRTPVELNIWAGSTYHTELFLNALREKGEVNNFEYSLKTKAGKIITVLLSTVKMDLNGEVCRISLMKDITREKKLEAELTRLDRLNLVGEMAAGIGHEVRNPMTTVRGFLQLLRVSMAI
ncbi:MAG: Sporulation kinase E [Firmicutes bacterium ADurb.Bin373]|nr:MAG: Sporulation kinase E [Firmicutes bacterium ADurb.Bin373]